MTTSRPAMVFSRWWWPFWLAISSAQAQTTTVQITEYLADNESILADEDGDFQDWLEVQRLTRHVGLLVGPLPDG